MNKILSTVIPAKAGIQTVTMLRLVYSLIKLQPDWIPACAGMTK